MNPKLKEEIEKLEKSKGYLEADIRLSQTNKILSIVKEIIDEFDKKTDKLVVDRNERYLDEYEKGHRDGWNDCLEELDDYIQELKQSITGDKDETANT